MEMETNISDIPEDVLSSIISFLGIEDVLPTRLLSKTWRHLRVPTVDINEERFCRRFGADPTDFALFVGFALNALQRFPGTGTIKTLGIHSPSANSDYMSLWVRIALDLQVEEIVISGRVAHSPSEAQFMWPIDLWNSPHLKALRLHAGGIFPAASSVNLPQLVTLRLQLIGFSSNNGLINFLEGCTGLQNFVAGGIWFTESAGENLQPNLPHLKTLDFELMKFASNRTFLNFLLGCPMLDSLSAYQVRFDEITEVDIPLNLPCLKNLLLNGIMFSSSHALLSFLSGCPTVESLVLRGIRFPNHLDVLEEDSMEINLPCLKNLDLSYMMFSTNRGFLKFLFGCPNVESLVAIHNLLDEVKELAAEEFIVMQKLKKVEVRFSDWEVPAPVFSMARFDLKIS
ncbi:FBD-associated F-box protein At3g52670-like [Lotus japonicus]|uniref:FBD-associated F-box protein At3g52670-like n=1 Tax=Lotus japonicus TaxID=34305 RepID=UPI0025868F07|nr:FBD-associated F-box protein At3g52670-like [Lotus japonicus]